uniref:Putative secreted protein n=1 Tax=Rhipicephalus microplus TaxID=6941 RepID=A0A6M2DC24_RHIMP
MWLWTCSASCICHTVCAANIILSLLSNRPQHVYKMCAACSQYVPIMPLMNIESMSVAQTLYRKSVAIINHIARYTRGVQINMQCNLKKRGTELHNANLVYIVPSILY